MGGVNLNKKLWRIPQQGMVKGVCAGIAHYLDVPVKLVRILVVLSIFFGLAFFTFVAYIVLTFVWIRCQTTWFPENSSHQAVSYWMLSIVNWLQVKSVCVSMERYVTS